VRSWWYRLSKSKDQSTIEYLGCNIIQFKAHIEQDPKFGMLYTWDNYGTYWDFDHILPVLYNNPTEQEKITRLHYTNIQPLSHQENIEKQNNLRCIDTLKLMQSTNQVLKDQITKQDLQKAIKYEQEKPKKIVIKVKQSTINVSQ
jgi:hypothetical protein